ncbi:MAG: NAD(P)-dependent alcohol dehydrogenase [Cyanobacteria bacterium J06632_22]
MTSRIATATARQAESMQAMVQSVYGAPEVLALATVNKPVPSQDEVLVRVQAASVNAGDWHLMRGTPWLIRLMFGGLRRPAVPTLGSDVAGQVEAVGQAVTQFKPGDMVFADLSGVGFGAFAEYVCVPASVLVEKPDGLSFTAAASVPLAAVTALQGLRDAGQLRPGQKVLINGASGGVGSFAVQIAKALGAEVTAVCSTQKMAMVQSLHPDHIVDYTQTDVVRSQQRYDLILDAAAYRSARDYLPILSLGGSYVLIGGSTDRFFQVLLLGGLFSKLSGRRLVALAAEPKAEDLTTIKTMVEAGQIVPTVDRCFGLSEVADAIGYMEQRQVQGKIVICIGDSNSTSATSRTVAVPEQKR